MLNLRNYSRLARESGPRLTKLWHLLLVVRLVVFLGLELCGAALGLWLSQLATPLVLGFFLCEFLAQSLHSSPLFPGRVEGFEDGAHFHRICLFLLVPLEVNVCVRARVRLRLVAVLLIFFFSFNVLRRHDPRDLLVVVQNAQTWKLFRVLQEQLVVVDLGLELVPGRVQPFEGRSLRNPRFIAIAAVFVNQTLLEFSVQLLGLFHH